jgi:hypothetical protein
MKNTSKRFYLLLMLAVVTSTLFIYSCKKDNEDVTLPPIGGYNTSDEIAPTNLIAKWTFDNTLTEKISNLTGTGTSTAFGTGIKNQAYQGSSTEARYAIYDAGTKIPALNSYTISFWMKSDQTIPNPDPDPVQGKGTQGIFALADATDFWGGINLFLEQNGTNADTIKVKLLVKNKRAGVVWQGQDAVYSVPASVGKWVHITYTYDASTSKVTVYKDGQQGGTKSLSGPYGPYDGSNTLYANDPGSSTNVNGAPTWGLIELPAATKMVIGAHQFGTVPPLNTGGTPQSWATTYAGLLDEFRIYNKALTSSDVSSLYALEKAGR